MKQTLLKVKNLEKFIEKHGDDSFISQSISKMLAYKIKNYEAEIKRLDKELKTFERTYGMKSSVFFKKFSEGRLGDNMDFIEWSSLYQMYNGLLEKKVELEGKR
ncbi:MAG: hypothetical protein HS132_06120 [Planctomycetia bacterium]|nr:hypothetical protein [Planctomycetia bacterium]